jgi:hypothetical protein
MGFGCKFLHQARSNRLRSGKLLLDLGGEMRTIETTATITQDGILTAKVPSDIMPGDHRIVLVIEQDTGGAVLPEPKPALEFRASPWTG